jgi:hypothetical protein
MKKIRVKQKTLYQAIIYAVFLCSFSVFPPLYTVQAQQSDPDISAFLAKEVFVLKEQVIIHVRNETEALQALEQSGKALDLSIKNKNTEAESISRQAVALAEEALSEARKHKAREQARLNKFEVFLKRESSRIAFGVPTIVKGNVFKKTKSGTVPFDGNSPVVAGDIIETGKNGFLEIALPDYSYISIGANTSIEISELSREKKQSLYNILRTEFYLAKLNIKRKCYLPGRDGCWITRYRVAPNVAIGVRGTEFNIQQNSDGSTTLIVFEGVLEVTETNADKLIKVNAMEQLIIDKDASIHGPISVKADSIQRWWEIVP